MLYRHRCLRNSLTSIFEYCAFTRRHENTKFYNTAKDSTIIHHSPLRALPDCLLCVYIPKNTKNNYQGGSRQCQLKHTLRITKNTEKKIAPTRSVRFVIDLTRSYNTISIYIYIYIFMGTIPRLVSRRVLHNSNGWII